MKTFNRKLTAIMLGPVMLLSLAAAPMKAQATTNNVESIYSSASVLTSASLDSKSSREATREGVWRGIDPSKAQDLLEWATSSKLTLEEGKVAIAKLTVKERGPAYRRLMVRVVESSGTKQNELLMRVSLNRGLEVDDILQATSKATDVTDGLKRRLLKEAIDLAITSFEEDASFLNGVQLLNQSAGTQAAASGDVNASTAARSQADIRTSDMRAQMAALSVPQASFEVTYAGYLKERAINATSYEGTYQLLKFAMTQLYNGLDNSLHRRAFAKTITKIADVASTLPEQVPLDPSQALTQIRNLKAALDEIVTDAQAVKIGGNTIRTSPNQGGLVNGLGMIFSKIPAGEFLMGSPTYESNRDSDEAQHKVRISKSFEMQTTEVTQKQWQAIMQTNPSKFIGENRPVEQVSWDDIQIFITKLNQQNRDGYTYRVPTEAEWEYAARGGTQTAYSFGDTNQDINQYAWYDGNSANETHTVAQLKPNQIGLFDMHGNVWEWVQDAYQKDLTQLPSTDPIVNSGPTRVIRGGSWYYDAQYLRSANRAYNSTSNRNSYLGFRLVRTIRR